MEKLEKFYRTRADFPDWMTEEEWNKKEIEIIKECLEPKIKQTMEELFNGIKCPLALSVEYDEENGVSVNIHQESEEETKEDYHIERHIRRSGRVGFIVEFPDGTVVQRNNAKETMIATLRFIGLNRVATFRSRTFAGIPLVTRTRRSDGDNKWQEEVDAWYVYTNISNYQKIGVLHMISEEFNLGLVIKTEDGEVVGETNNTRSRGKRQMFTIDGKGYFNKRNCVLETVKQYLKQHPETTSQQLQNVFPAEVQGGYGVVRPLSWVRQQQQSGKDFLSRYFIHEDDVINTIDGEQLVVSNQWGNRFLQFIYCAKNAGLEIEEIG